MRNRSSLPPCAAAPSAVVLVLLLAFPLSSLAEVVLGGGKAASDCYGAFDVAGADGGRRLVCVDGDPACDVEGACQGICTFRVAVCLNLPDVEGCTPKPLRKATASEPLVVPTPQDAEAVCGAPVAIEVPLRGRARNRPRKKKLRLTVVAAGRPRKDGDTIILRCEPRLEGSCPSTTTTSLGGTGSTSTSSTLGPPSTTTSTTTSTSASTTTSTTTSTSTTLPSTTPCEDDGDCPVGVCSQGVCCNRACPAPCNICSVATGGICTAVACGDPGTCETGPGTCDLDGACVYPTAADGTACREEGDVRICCGGTCCDAGEDCVDGACALPCAPLGETCEAEEQCCQDGVTFCEGTCCHGLEESCTSDAECCTGHCRDGEACCAPPGADCVSEGDCCTAGLGDCELEPGGRRCRCLQAGEACGSSQECCGLGVCVDGVCQAGTCLAPQTACQSGFDCCWDGPTVCDDATGTGAFACCRGNDGTCTTDPDCCGDEPCQNGRCCRRAGESCNPATLCCAGLACREGACLPSCPLGSFPCGATCCGNYQHCVQGTCQCVALGAACDPTNNLCCQSEATLCPALNPFGNAETCCRPQGGHCSSAADCCTEIYDNTWGRDTCGDDGVCGGNGAYCGADTDCVGDLICVGLCHGTGQGFQLCATSGECPAGQLCSQRRCIHPDDLPD